MLMLKQNSTFLSINVNLYFLSLMTSTNIFVFCVLLDSIQLQKKQWSEGYLMKEQAGGVRNAVV